MSSNSLAFQIAGVSPTTRLAIRHACANGTQQQLQRSETAHANASTLATTTSPLAALSIQAAATMALWTNVTEFAPSLGTSLTALETPHASGSKVTANQFARQSQTIQLALPTHNASGALAVAAPCARTQSFTRTYLPAQPTLVANGTKLEFANGAAKPNTTTRNRACGILDASGTTSVATASSVAQPDRT